MIKSLIEKMRRDEPQPLDGKPEAVCECKYIHDILCMCNSSRCYGYTNKSLTRHMSDRKEYDG